MTAKEKQREHKNHDDEYHDRNYDVLCHAVNADDDTDEAGNTVSKSEVSFFSAISFWILPTTWVIIHMLVQGGEGDGEGAVASGACNNDDGSCPPWRHLLAYHSHNGEDNGYCGAAAANDNVDDNDSEEDLVRQDDGKDSALVR